MSSSRLQLSDFHVLQTLGVGGFGRVHLVRPIGEARWILFLLFLWAWPTGAAEERADEDVRHESREETSSDFCGAEGPGALGEGHHEPDALPLCGQVTTQELLQNKRGTLLAKLKQILPVCAGCTVPLRTANTCTC